MKKLSEFLTINEHVEFWNGKIWFGGHPGSGRSPSSPQYDPRRNGREHNGTDFACQRGDLRAPHDGKIKFARWQNNGAGHAVTINHGDTLIDVGTRFAGEVRMVYSRHLHMSPDKKWQTKTFKVREGQQVVRGQLLGTSGTSGASAGVHCHCELVLGKPFRPATDHMNLDSELVYTGATMGYWGGGEQEMAMVEDMQKSLNANGFADPPLIVDGNWGSKTAAANAARDAAASQSGNDTAHAIVQVYAPPA